MKFRREDFFSLPNILTYIRILLVPLFVVLYLNAKTWHDHAWVIIVILLSAFTDVIDGYIARKWKMITDWGKIIDPIADKLMQGAMMICVALRYHWVILLILIYAIKEFTSLSLSGYLFKKGKTIDGAHWYGKLCTVVLYVVMLCFIVFPKMPAQISGILIGASAAFMVLAFILYMNEYISLYAELKEEEKAGTYVEPGRRFYIRENPPKNRRNSK